MRNRFVQIVFGLVLVGILVQVVLIAPSQIRDNEPLKEEGAVLAVGAGEGGGAAPSAPASSDVDQSMNGMHMIETHEGGKEWELWADKAVSVKSKELIQLESVKAVFFTQSGTTFTVTGQKGSVQVKSKDLRVEGNVSARSSNGYVFHTPSMIYESARRRLEAPENVRMVGPKDSDGNALHLTGGLMYANLKEGLMHVERDVKAEKSVGSGKVAHIRSQHSQFTAQDRSASFSGDVILDMNAMRITGPSARFEYGKQGDRVRSVIFSGGAKVSDADKWATAQNVRVDFESNRFVFRGNPRVMQSGDELRGEEIVFLDGGRRVQVKSARARVDEKRMEKVH